MDRLHYFLFTALLALVNANSTLLSRSSDHIRRRAKFFGVGVVRFENSVCSADDGLDGTCYTKRQCKSIGGIQSGSCASNIGVCCVVQQTCGGSSSNNNTYFANAAFPKTVSSGTSCSFTIEPCGSDVCQVRIDFLSLTLAQPNANGACVYDSMNIIGGATTIPTICGENSGQHIYVDFNGVDNIRINIETSSEVSVLRSWKFRITQIGCECANRAPPGCLMYYTDLSGTVRSFNFGSTASSELLDNGRLGTRELINLNYGVCVGVAAGFCSIRWSQSSGSYTFAVSGSTINATAAGIIGTTDAGLHRERCTTDFIVIPNPYSNVESYNTDRFCGNGLPTLTTSSKPFVLTVVTNGNEVHDTGNRGFSLDFTQLRCNSVVSGY